MAGDKMPSWREARKAERNKNLLMVLIPAVLIILILVITIAGRFRGDGDNQETGQTAETEVLDSGGADSEDNGTLPESPTETMPAESVAEPGAEDGLTQFKKDEVVQINELMKAYMAARVKGDAEAIYKLYGKDVDYEIEVLRAELLLNARELTSIDNVVCYTMAGAAEHSWIAVVTASASYRNVETQVPIILGSYVTMDEEGNYLLVDEAAYTAEQEAAMAAAMQTEDALALYNQVITAQREAVASDETLTRIYGQVHSGSPAWQTEATEPETEPEVVILPE